VAASRPKPKGARVPPRSVVRVLVLCLGLLALAGCARGCTSRRPPILLIQEMDNQPKYRPQAESGFFHDGAAMQPPVEGTVARGELKEDVRFHTGREPTGEFTANPLDGGRDLIARGRERYQIYCTPCHGAQGDGQGMLFARSGLPVADLLEERIAQMPDGEMFDVITYGVGLMAGYAYAIPAADRWAIVAYVRELREEHRAATETDTGGAP
jgi:mono/diheme cytochrome c family protein